MLGEPGTGRCSARNLLQSLLGGGGGSGPGRDAPGGRQQVGVTQTIPFLLHGPSGTRH